MIFNNTGIDFQSNNISLGSFCVFVFWGEVMLVNVCVCVLLVGWWVVFVKCYICQSY